MDMKQRKIFSKPYGNTIGGLMLLALCTALLYAFMSLVVRPATGFSVLSAFDRDLNAALDPLYKDPDGEHAPWSEITVSTDEYLDRAEQVCIRYVTTGDVDYCNRDDEQGTIYVRFKYSGSYLIEAPNGELAETLNDLADLANSKKGEQVSKQ